MRPNYISSGTQSVQITPVDVGSFPYMSLTPTTVNVSSCPTSGGVETCSASLVVPVGQYQFEIEAYDAPNAAGSVLSTTYSPYISDPSGFPSSPPATVVTIGGTAIASLTLSPVPTTYEVAVSAVQSGVHSNLTVTLSAYDASGAQIGTSGAAMYATTDGMGAPYEGLNSSDDATQSLVTLGTYVPTTADPLAAATRTDSSRWPEFVSPEASLSLSYDGGYGGLSDGPGSGGPGPDVFAEPFLQFVPLGIGDAPSPQYPRCGEIACVPYSYRLLEDDSIAAAPYSVNFASDSAPAATITLGNAANSIANGGSYSEGVAESFSCGTASLSGSGTTTLTITPSVGMPAACDLYVYSSLSSDGIDASTALGYPAIGVPGTVIPVTVGGAQPPDTSSEPSDLVLSGSTGTITVTPAATYSGPVAIIPIQCFSSTGSFDPQINPTTATVINAVPASQIFTASSGASVNGSPVILTVTPKGKGMCLLATSPSATGLGTWNGYQVVPLVTVLSK